MSKQLYAPVGTSMDEVTATPTQSSVSPTPLLPIEPSQRAAWAEGPGVIIVCDFPLEDFGRALSLIVYTAVRRHHKSTPMHTATRTSRTKRGLEGHYNPLIAFDAGVRICPCSHASCSWLLSMLADCT